MMNEHKTWREYITELRAKWIGARVKYDGKVYRIVEVDYNGVLHINKPSEYNETTAVFLPSQAEKARI